MLACQEPLNDKPVLVLLERRFRGEVVDDSKAVVRVTGEGVKVVGVPPQTDESYYVGFEAAGQHIGLVPGGGPHDVGGGRLVATVTDPDGTVVGLLQDR